MKNLDLKLIGVQSMDTNEMKQTDGGNPIIVAIGVGASVVGLAWGLGFMA